LATESLWKCTNQSQSLPHFVAKKNSLLSTFLNFKIFFLKTHGKFASTNLVILDRKQILISSWHFYANLHRFLMQETARSQALEINSNLMKALFRRATIIKLKYT
jgi:hypothetical protein